AWSPAAGLFGSREPEVASSAGSLRPAGRQGSGSRVIRRRFCGGSDSVIRRCWLRCPVWSKADAAWARFMSTRLGGLQLLPPHSCRLLCRLPTGSRPPPVGQLSLLAGTATTPYIAYHFHRISPYGVIANLIAMPVVSAWMVEV